VTKRLLVISAIVGGISLLLVIVLTLIEGVKYRVREEQGLDPISAPDWVANLTSAGLAVCALAFVVLMVTTFKTLIAAPARPLDSDEKPLSGA
jgi:heme/copper-type cytochrome/quinol oxidase subunit 2